MNNQQKKERLYWIDNIKIACCLLVVLGHLYMSLVASRLLPANSIYSLFTQTVYTFHVPLFFLCSGYLYQRSSKPFNKDYWAKSILDKLINLGVPYFVFASITLLIKYIFSNEVNHQENGFLYSLFIRPISPYWYLYVLFFMFIFIPHVSDIRFSKILLKVSVILKLFSIVINEYHIHLPYVLESLTSNMIWFVIGIYIAFNHIKLESKKSRAIAGAMMIVALGISLYFFRVYEKYEAIKAIVAILMVLSIVIFAQSTNIKAINKLSFKLSDLFLPVYVMHTIFAAGVRIILLKLGVTNVAIHIIAGLVASLLLPAITYYIARGFKPLLFLFYPKRVLNSRKSKD